MPRTAMTTALAASVFAAISLVSVDAAACGESLFRVGKGMTYRAHTAPLPGNIVVVTETEAHRAFAERLAAAGHHVETVDDATQLATILASREFDIVLAKFSDRAIVAAQFASAPSSAVYLPVTSEESEQDLAKSFSRYPLAESDSFATFLKAIHRTLKG